MSKLNKGTIGSITVKAGEKDYQSLMELPERVLQFGTGVLLRGLPDVYIDLANKQGVFNGRVLVVKSTDTPGSDDFQQQDGLYTVVVRGFENGQAVDRWDLNASISRVLAANSHWNTILTAAENPAMQVVVSNTTEVGIVLVEESIHANPPASFPAKLLSFLYKRYQHFNGSAESGMVIIPTELISENGHKLQSILLDLAKFNQLDIAFTDWLVNANDFCNSLVDRIVPGKLPAADAAILNETLGFEDSLMIMAEPYSLWAIETNRERTKEILSFASVNPGVKLTTDISKYKELKLRLLNATHSFSCALAMLSEFETVKEAMASEQFRGFVSALMMEEIKPLVVSSSITEAEAQDFAQQVIDRFRNNSIEHRWVNISMQYSLKMASRCMPLIQRAYEQGSASRKRMLLGFAAYLLLMRTVQDGDGKYYAEVSGNRIALTDEKLASMHICWQETDLEKTVTAILQETSIWNANLASIPGLKEDLVQVLVACQEQGITEILRTLKD
jgi:tagaturonate reductase